ncbi:hypothetical protein [Chitiniphilus shinanonensis]|uniref:hypothetical protein n=1 Tax=Chitiniphilus shinanonensis TaxID=553088 RepID=UPI0012FA7B55|nr:hypothetical protein [Chitiniphilus shinanonensis]
MIDQRYPSGQCVLVFSIAFAINGLLYYLYFFSGFNWVAAKIDTYFLSFPACFYFFLPHREWKLLAISTSFLASSLFWGGAFILFWRLSGLRKLAYVVGLVLVFFFSAKMMEYYIWSDFEGFVVFLKKYL